MGMPQEAQRSQVYPVHFKLHKELSSKLNRIYWLACGNIDDQKGGIYLKQELQCHPVM